MKGEKSLGTTSIKQAPLFTSYFLTFHLSPFILRSRALLHRLAFGGTLLTHLFRIGNQWPVNLDTVAVVQGIRELAQLAIDTDLVLAGINLGKLLKDTGSTDS